MSDNKPEPLPSSTLLNRGEFKTILLNSGASVLVKVRLLPERHLNQFLDLRDIGREADMLAFVLQRNVAPADQEPRFEVVNPKDEKQAAEQAEFVDDIQSEGFAELLETADKLNFARAVSQAERQIAMANALLPLKRRVSETQLAPIADSLRSLTSSLISQLSSAVASRTPATNQSPG